MAFILIYITHKNMEEAKKVVSHLLQKKMIACANFFPIKSAYWWKGKIDETDEVVSIVKTIKGNWKKVKSEVKKIHHYEVPCIMKIDAKANAEYEKWIKEAVK